MLVSPIMMVPMFRTPKQLQEDYLHHFNDMSLRKGVCVCVCVCVCACARACACVPGKGPIAFLKVMPFVDIN